MFAIVSNILRRYLLAFMCILAPVLFSGLAGKLAQVVTHDAAGRVEFNYKFINSQRSAEPETVSSTSRVSKTDPAFLAPALDIRGRIRYAAASALLWFVSCCAFCFGFGIVWERTSFFQTLLIALCILFSAGWVSVHSEILEQLRPLLVERVLAEAANVQALPTQGGWFEDFFQFFFGGRDLGRPGATVLTLVRLNAVVGLTAVGMLLLVLAIISIRSDQSDLTLDEQERELTERRRLLSVALGFGSAVLVLGIVTTTLLADWPTSMLVESQRNAIGPIDDAHNLQIGVSSTIALMAAVTPALYSLYLDRCSAIEAGRAAIARVKTRRKQPPGKPAEEDVSFWSWASAGSVLAVFAPVLAPAILDLLKKIIGNF